jgi:two-component system, OmpR family, alkaline phosphatase synthesis response regulator PhoP
MAKHIFCIDDDRNMLALLRFILEQEGYVVSSTPRSNEGLPLMRRRKPDLVLLDVMMPGQDGWDICRQIKSDPELASTPIIMVTSRSQDADKALGYKVDQVKNYVNKPFLSHELLSAVAAVLV